MKKIFSILAVFVFFGISITFAGYTNVINPVRESRSLATFRNKSLRRLKVDAGGGISHYSGIKPLAAKQPSAMEDILLPRRNIRVDFSNGVKKSRLSNFSYTKNTSNRTKLVKESLDKMEIKSYILMSSPIALTSDEKNQIKGRRFYKRKQNNIGIILEFYPAYRKDDVSFNIGGGSGGPNIISELTWKDLQILQLEGAGKIVFDKTWRLEGSMDYGWIVDGDNQDSDYLGDDRTFEFSRSYSSTDNDDVFDWSLGLGYQWDVGRMESLLVDDLSLAFLGGYSYHEQNLNDTDGVQIVSDFGLGVPLGPFDGLNSTYQTKWRGPWIGGEAVGRKNKWLTFLRFEYHWAEFDAIADWNLRTDFAHPISYTHWADGTGTVFSLGAGYIFNSKWTGFLRMGINDWKTDAGIIRFFLSDGTSSDQPLNEVKWESTAFKIGLKYSL